MDIRLRVQRLIERLPEDVASPIVHVPFSIRLGRSYPQTRRRLMAEERGGLAFDAPGQWERLRGIVQFANARTAFYRRWYGDHGFDPASLRSWDDWQRVPIVTRNDMQKSPLSDRCVTGAPGMKINTGGTSGQPLEFLLDNEVLGREWAHMHFIWASRGYRTTHRKLTLRGKHFDSGRVLRFNAVSNEYVANSNVPMQRIVDEVIKATRRRPIRWIHGYPSLAAEFAIELSSRPHGEQCEVRDRLFGILLGSEFPAPQYRSPIAEILSSNITSWYGHSEMALLARETSAGTYSTFPTYGFAEAVPAGDGTHRLVCTSLANRAHPFVRYDTGDLVQPISTRRGALEFKVTEGRVGEFITDAKGHRHALTAVIFGRHHEAFELVRHIQVHQVADGHATLVATPRRPDLRPEDVMSRMELSGLDFTWAIRLVEEPVRTRYGKIKLKLAPGDIATR
jgi:phenylacetate-CoA ligase